MGDRNQLLFIEDNMDKFDGPYLEIGSRDYGNTQDIRGLVGKKEGDSQNYIGIDMISGKGVDHVLDLTIDISEIDKVLDGKRFGTIFCLSVLEHCDQPFKMAENMTKLLAPGGKVYISAPFAWMFHGYPSDYWRFTHEGIKKLFPDIEFEEGLEVSSVDREVKTVSNDIGRVNLRGGYHRREGRWIRSFWADIFKTIGRVGLLKWIFAYPYLMRPTCIYMVGTLKK